VTYPAKRFVYIIRSVKHPQKRYIGISADVAARVSAHNGGQNRATAPWKPWDLDVTIEFRTERLALRFERYLKSGAGHAFAIRHLSDVRSELELVPPRADQSDNA
jgi:predicted GIY-YIG superfamily endonuclease